MIDNDCNSSNDCTIYLRLLWNTSDLWEETCFNIFNDVPIFCWMLVSSISGKISDQHMAVSMNHTAIDFRTRNYGKGFLKTICVLRQQPRSPPIFPKDPTFRRSVKINDQFAASEFSVVVGTLLFSAAQRRCWLNWLHWRILDKLTIS